MILSWCPALTVIVAVAVAAIVAHATYLWLEER